MELAVEVGGVPQLGRGWAPLVCQRFRVRLPVGAAVPLHTSLPLDMAVVGSLTGVMASEMTAVLWRMPPEAQLR